MVWRSTSRLLFTPNRVAFSGILGRNSIFQNPISPSFQQSLSYSSPIPQQQQQNLQSDEELTKLIPILNPNTNVPKIEEDCFAIVHLSGKQQKVCADDVILTEKLVHASTGDIIRLDKVLLIGTKTSTIIGTPRVQDAFVMAEVQEQTKAEKIVIFKKKRRKGYQRRRGFRPHITVLKILDVHYDLPKES